MSAIKGNVKKFGSQFLKSAQTLGAPSNNTKSNALGNFVFFSLCQPARVYLIFAFLSLLYFVYIEQGLIWLIIKAIIFITWAFLLNKLCTSGNTAIAWLLAIVPQCIFLLVSARSVASASSKPMAPAPTALGGISP